MRESTHIAQIIQKPTKCAARRDVTDLYYISFWRLTCSCTTVYIVMVFKSLKHIGAVFYYISLYIIYNILYIIYIYIYIYLFMCVCVCVCQGCKRDLGLRDRDETEISSPRRDRDRDPPRFPETETFEK